MDAAVPSRIEKLRLLHCGRERVSMEKTLTESEFAAAISEGLPKFIALAQRLTGNEDLASEAVQNALLKASKSWRRFRGQSHVQTWMTRIVIHASRDVLAAKRKRKIRVTPNPGIDDQTQPADLAGPHRTPSQQLMDRELNQIVRSAVQALPDRQREVFALSVWQGLPASEIGQLLNITAQTVHANLHVARTRLRELLASYVDSKKESE